MKGFAPKSWVLRGKDENDTKFEHVVEAFAKGCVLDLDTLQLGWMKDGATGQAPEKKWNPHFSQATPRPDESKSEGGGFAWRNALSVRVAIGGGETATWEDEGWGVYLGFSNMIQNLINPGFAANIGKCPHVRCIGYVKQGSGQKSTSIPQFEIVAWVDRPAALMEDAPQIASAPQPSAPVAAPAPRPSANEVDF